MNYLIRALLVIVLITAYIDISAEAKIDEILSFGLSNFERNQLKIKELKGGLSGTLS